MDNPVQSLSTLGFMLPACSSGNVVFPNENLLRAELAKTPVKDYVVSIDTIADVAFSQAQKFAKEAVFYVIACVLILVSMIFAGILTAQLWVSENRKRIFTLHTFGDNNANLCARIIYCDNHGNYWSSNFFCYKTTRNYYSFISKRYYFDFILLE